MNILITGANGQLGSEIKDLSTTYSHTFFFEGSKTLDITNAEVVENYILNNKINAVINCAAYTAVDKAEQDSQNAERVNALGVRNLISSIEKVSGKIIHISTDYVFNGENFTPYKENEDVNPLGVYGKTKRVGEEFLLSSNVEGIIIRTSWLYSSYGNNFVKTMIRLGNERDSLGVIADQIGAPTYARDLAKACLEIISCQRKLNEHSKIYHYSNEGVASWYDFSKAIMNFSQIQCEVSPIETKDYPTPANRPHYSVLNKNKIKTDFNIKIPYWRDSLKICIETLVDNK